MNMSLDELIIYCNNQLEKLFMHYLKDSKCPAPLLQEAMYYAVHNGGKRLRPLLVYATGLTLGATLENLDAAAAAIELIHTYSLIHDDLPAMDNSDLRRGKPSCHKAYNESLAILAGDALQPLAFEILASHPSALTDLQRLNMIKVLSEACGMHGMVAGQVLDMETMQSYEALETMYSLKTGNLIYASVKLGLLASPKQDADTDSLLTSFAKNIGLAFQIQDDLLDIESNTVTLGKPQGIDQTNKKITFPSLIGIEKAHEKVEMLFNQVELQLKSLGIASNILNELTKYIIQRKK